MKTLDLVIIATCITTFPLLASGENPKKTKASNRPTEKNSLASENTRLQRELDYELRLLDSQMAGKLELASSADEAIRIRQSWSGTRNGIIEKFKSRMSGGAAPSANARLQSAQEYDISVLDAEMAGKLQFAISADEADRIRLNWAARKQGIIDKYKRQQPRK